jgi:hypothetical protein
MMKVFKMINSVGQLLEVILVESRYSDDTLKIDLFYKSSDGTYRFYDSLTQHIQLSVAMSGYIAFIKPKYFNWVVQNQIGTDTGLFGKSSFRYNSMFIINKISLTEIEY